MLRRDCAYADHSHPSLSTALLSGWSSHLVIIGFRLTFPLSQARTPWTRQARLRSSKACVRGHERSASHLHNQVQTSNKAHDKFMPRRDCACADHSRPSLSTALLSGWSSHLVIIGFRLTAPLSQAPSLGQDELTRRKRALDTRGLSVRLHTLFFSTYPFATCFPFSSFSRYIP